MIPAHHGSFTTLVIPILQLPAQHTNTAGRRKQPLALLRTCTSDLITNSITPCWVSCRVCLLVYAKSDICTHSQYHCPEPDPPLLLVLDPASDAPVAAVLAEPACKQPGQSVEKGNDLLEGHMDSCWSMQHLAILWLQGLQNLHTNNLLNALAESKLVGVLCLRAMH